MALDRPIVTVASLKERESRLATQKSLFERERMVLAQAYARWKQKIPSELLEELKTIFVRSASLDDRWEKHLKDEAAYNQDKLQHEEVSDADPQSARQPNPPPLLVASPKADTESKPLSPLQQSELMSARSPRSIILPRVADGKDPLARIRAMQDERAKVPSRFNFSPRSLQPLPQRPSLFSAAPPPVMAKCGSQPALLRGKKQCGSPPSLQSPKIGQ